MTKEQKLVERLRSRHIRLHADDLCLMRDAADEIERLQHDLEKALKNHSSDISNLTWYQTDE